MRECFIAVRWAVLFRVVLFLDVLMWTKWWSIVVGVEGRYCGM